MPFEKEISGNPQGRKQGSQNKKTKELKEIIKETTQGYFSKSDFIEDLQDLTPKHRIDLMIKLLEFVVPIIKTVEEEKQEVQRPSSIEHFKDLIIQMDNYNSRRTNSI